MRVVIILYALLSENDELNDSFYVPKSKRWKICRTMKKFVIKILENM